MDTNSIFASLVDLINQMISLVKQSLIVDLALGAFLSSIALLFEILKAATRDNPAANIVVQVVEFLFWLGAALFAFYGIIHALNQLSSSLQAIIVAP